MEIRIFLKRSWLLLLVILDLFCIFTFFWNKGFRNSSLFSFNFDEKFKWGNSTCCASRSSETFTKYNGVTSIAMVISPTFSLYLPKLGLSLSTFHPNEKSEIMAELAVSAALVLVEIVSPLLNKLNLPKDVHKDVKSMKSWLSSMKAFIEDNYDREGSRVLEDQVEKVRDMAYDIEDVLEEFVLHSPPYTFHNHRITRKLHKVAHDLRHIFPLRGISEKIASIRSDIDDFKSQNDSFSHGNSNPRPSSSSTRPPVVSSLFLDDEMVGYEKPKKEFMRQLVDEEKRVVLAVDGHGGSGKTTFVKNVFWKRGIPGKFDCHAWVRVSRHFDLEERFINMLKQFCDSRKEPYPTDDGSDAPTKLRRYLAGKRYVVVLDDIWRKEDWNDFKIALPDSFRGSRIVVTTRSSNVARLCASSSHHIYSLNGLEWLEGWNLFCRKAFPDSNGECPSELKDCCVKIVTRCEGLPLAIVAVGGALAQKPRRSPYEWQRFHDSLGCEIRSGSNLSVISNALLPGYMDLSSNLKCCFLYFSIFPEDYSVERGRLIRLWVAERFAMETDCETAEDVAEDYLNKLIHRNLVHVSNWDFDGRPRSCRVLNLVLEFIKQKCKSENFASIFSRENTSHSQKIRRLSVHNDCTHLPGNSDFGGVRSMFLLRLLKLSPSDFEKNIRKVKLLRVLDLQGAPDLTEFPKDITRLTLLRFLSLRDTKIKMIPSSIKNLSYLETLDLKQTDVTELPQEISYLHKLCHLFVYKYNVKNFVFFDSVQGVKVCEGICNLTNLQDLSLVKVDQKGGVLKDLKKLRKLRKLGLTGLKREHGKDLCAAVELMEKLTTLDVCSTTKDEYLELGAMKNPPQTLQRLYLKGRLKEFPGWISSLNNLLRIGLKWSKMQDSPLKALERLPNLMELQLEDCCSEGELIFEASCFKKLKILLIEDFTKLHTIVIRDGAMPDLKQISLRRCRQLMMFLGAHNLIKVEELTLYDMSEDFVARVRMNDEDLECVKRIPVIHSFTLINNQSWSFENLSDSFSH